VEQNRVKRGGVGLRGHDPERAWPGFTLFSCREAGPVVYLIDMEGNLVHSWEMPYRPGDYGYLTDRGTLFYNGQIRDDTWFGQRPWKGGAALEVDWNGRVLWEVRHPEHHHDGIRLANGNVLLLCSTELPEGIASRVRGGRPGTEHDGRMNADYLVEMTTDGRLLWEWRSWEHLDPEADGITAVQDGREEWTHGNGVAELPDGNIVVSFRNNSTVVIVDRRTGAVVWKLGAPPLSGQHAPTPLPNGHLLIFDNGPHRLDHAQPHSRVIEVDIASKEIVWTYLDSPLTNFYSPRVSNAQRLPNGNTLICEGVFGRLFEVTANGETVWEYVNPFFGGPPGAQVNQVFRAYRYSAEEVARARSTS
jgi:hypothetical protein